MRKRWSPEQTGSLLDHTRLRRRLQNSASVWLRWCWRTWAEKCPSSQQCRQRERLSATTTPNVVQYLQPIQCFLRCFANRLHSEPCGMLGHHKILFPCTQCPWCWKGQTVLLWGLTWIQQHLVSVMSSIRSRFPLFKGFVFISSVLLSAVIVANIQF